MCTQLFASLTGLQAVAWLRRRVRKVDRARPQWHVVWSEEGIDYSVGPAKKARHVYNTLAHIGPLLMGWRSLFW